MSKILLTGMTASQASQSANAKSRQFAHNIFTALTSAKHEVVWVDPSIHWTAQEIESRFDAVIVGIAPLTGLPANRAYGALSLINKMYFSDKLYFFLDAPEPMQIVASLTSVAKGASDLFKPFYSYRKFYDTVKSGAHRQEIESAVERLSTKSWPITFYPSLPWEKEPLQLGMLDVIGLPMPLNLDSFVISPGKAYASTRENVWAIDSYRTKWSLAVAKGLVHPTTPMRQSKGSTDRDVDLIMDAALGSILSPQKAGGTWWSYRYAQAMNAASPIATEWRESSHIGNAWNYLPAAIEGLTQSERLNLSHAQKRQYLAAIGTADKALFELESFLGLKR